MTNEGLDEIIKILREMHEDFVELETQLDCREKANLKLHVLENSHD